MNQALFDGLPDWALLGIELVILAMASALLGTALVNRRIYANPGWITRIGSPRAYWIGTTLLGLAWLAALIIIIRCR